MSVFNVRNIKKEELPGLLDLYGHLHEDDPRLCIDNNLEKLWREIISK